MQHQEILNKRNLFTLITYLFSNLVVSLVIISQQFHHQYNYLFFCGISFILLIALYLFKIDPKIFQFILIANWHILLFIYNFQSESPITIYSYIYLIGVLAIYRSFLINFANIILILLELH